MSEKPKRQRMAWRKQPRPTRLAGTAAAGRPDAYELRLGDTRLMTVAYDRSSERWYYYGCGVNSLLVKGGTFACVTDAKIDAREYAKLWLQEQPNVR